jgi:prolyl-tRNA editing enzyme YbaK/EbsC (Cys-tRNA(Pro) deacylase)
MDTPITKFLDSKGIPYRFLPHKKPAFTCEDAAKERGVPLGEMVKCILLVDKKKSPFLVCMASNKMIDTKAVRAFLGCLRLSFASKEETGELLGYEVGAIPPLLLKTDIPILFDNSIAKKEKVNISSGIPEAGVELSLQDLIFLANPKFGDFSK